MERITSFSVDHDLIEKGIYISRIDGDVTTYDMRTRKPNMGEYMDNLTMHSVEHMFATYIRNGEIGKDVIYFGPMGCQTGFYLLVRGRDDERVLRAVFTALEGIISHKGDMVGATREECGNYKCLDIGAAIAECKRYLSLLKSKKCIDFKYEDSRGTKNE